MESKAFKFHIPINSHQLQGLMEKPQDLLKLLPKNELENFRWFIFDELSDKDGSPTVNNLLITKFSYDQTKNKGGFRMSFDIDRKFCCSDTESCKSDYLDFTFQINDNELEASGSYFDWTMGN